MVGQIRVSDRVVYVNIGSCVSYEECRAKPVLSVAVNHMDTVAGHDAHCHAGESRENLIELHICG